MKDANGEYIPLFGKLVNDEGQPNAMGSPDNYVIINGEPYALNTSEGLREWHGSAIPKAYGGFNFNLGWKGFSLNTVFTYSLGAKTFDGVYSNLMTVGSTVPHNYHKDIMNAWKGAPAGMTETSADRIDPNGIPEINSTHSNYNDATSSRWLVSSDYLILKNISLSYQFPPGNRHHRRLREPLHDHGPSGHEPAAVLLRRTGQLPGDAARVYRCPQTQLLK